MTNFVVLTLTDRRLNFKHVTMNTIAHDLPPVLFLCVIVLGHMVVHILFVLSCPPLSLYIGYLVDDIMENNNQHTSVHAIKIVTEFMLFYQSRHVV